jgi:hypothetical protein
LDVRQIHNDIDDSSLCELYLQIALGQRIGIAAALFIIALACVAPSEWNFYPEGNWFFGPLWFVLIESPQDKVIGVIVAVPLAMMICAFPVHPGVVSALVSIVGVGLWIACGVYLAIGAIV